MTLLDSALAYAAQGWPVFPCNPRSKQPLVKGDVDAQGKPVPNTGGVKKATTDAQTIRGWWQRWPKAMIALACGDAPGVFVLDVDAGEDKATGEEFTLEALLAALKAELGAPLPPTLTAVTPRGGRHFYFRQPSPGFGNGKGALGKIDPPRFDVRGQGGYVILPPSLRDDGKAYAWVAPPEFFAGGNGASPTPAEAPPSLLDCIAKVGRWAEAAPKPTAASPAKKDHSLYRGDQAHYSGANAAGGTRAPADAAAAEDQAVRRYALAALDAELRKVAEAVDGTRNNTLNEAAFALGQLVAAGALLEPMVRSALEAAVADWPDPHKTLGTIDSGLRGGKGKKRDLSEVKAQARERAARASAFAPPPQGPEDYGLQAQPSHFDGGNGASATPAMGAPDDHPPEEGGQKRGPQAPRRERAHQRGLKAAAAETKESLDLRLAFLPMTDLGNAFRFRERNRGRLLWCREMDGNWLAWDGIRWRRDGAAARASIAEHECVQAIKDEAEALRQSGKDVPVGGAKKKKPAATAKEKAAVMLAALAGQDTPEPEAEEEEPPVMYSDLLERWARTCEDAARMAPIAKHAAPYLAVSARELDADRYTINLLNGTLHAFWDAQGKPQIQFRDHDPDDLITKLAPVTYNKAAACPHYDRFLQQVQPNADNRRFLHQWGGYALTGDVAEQRLVFFWGKGRNGKSTLVDAWGLCLGDYGTAAPIETFLAEGRGRQGNAASPDLAMLKGVRFVRTSEPDKGAKLGEALIKLVTGGEPFPARELHKSFFMLDPQFKLTISGNYRPKIVGTDEGIWRRVTLVPWTVTIAKDKVDVTLPHKLAAETSGIFNRLLAGLADWMAHGLIIPQEVETATADYRRDSDPLGRFLDACVVADPGGQEQSSVLHKVFCAWCKSNGEREWTATGFGLAMSDRGFQSKKSNVSWWLNIKLTKSEGDFVDHEGRPLVAKKDGEAAADAAPADDEVPF